MTTVYNVIQSPDGEALVASPVEIKLVWDKSIQLVATDNANSVMLLGRYVTRTSVSGRWEVGLVPNDEISPVGSVYQITERVPPGKQAVTYFFEVPVESATPVDVWLGTILVDRPSYV